MPPKPAPTHFLCIPLVTPISRPQLMQSLASFHADVTSPTSFNIPDDAVRPVGTLHLTLGVFSFPSPPPAAATAAAAKAIELLQSLRLREILADAAVTGASTKADAGGVARQRKAGERPLRITLKGLHPMQASTPEKAAVLYAAPADDVGTLQAFCERVRGVFVQAGLMMVEGERPLLLHATLVNTVYVKGKSRAGNGGKGKGRGKRWERLTIDARGVVERYEDQVWMKDVPVEGVAICKMGARKTVVGGVEDEAYEVVGEVAF
ncbi:kinase A anchor protein [Podospora appendiculata]|uniref:Kinase A anchor protein n=1 Tax=Podospora appendiculata TaxID=314037 RepID=A0AAE0X359_9PEZI|nr:kinase A anchor protein [Podospora appendiculata]